MHALSMCTEHYMLPVKAPEPDYPSILTSAREAVEHKMSIVKLDPARPSVVSLSMSKTSPVLVAQQPSQQLAPAESSASSMLMVSQVGRTTRRKSLHPAAFAADSTAASPTSTETDGSAAAAASPIPAPVTGLSSPAPPPLIVPVTDTLDKSEVHLLSDILSRGECIVYSCSCCCRA